MNKTEAFATEIFKELDRYFTYDQEQNDIGKAWREEFGYKNETASDSRNQVVWKICAAIREWEGQ